ncbi:glycosyltransferase family protein [Pseudaeromonas pectinilytica]
MDEVIKRLMFKPYVSLGRSRLKMPQGATAPAERLYILHEGESATLAYFSLSIRTRYPHCDVHYQDIHLPPEPIAPGDVLIVIRYIPRSWQVWLDRQMINIHLIVYFMDDDLLDHQALSALPKSYRKKILKRGAEQHAWISLHCDQLWVSTPYLAKKYRHLDAVLISPSPCVSYLQRQKPVRLAYHGTSAHREEKQWLRSIMEGVLAARENVTFELFGEFDVYKTYRDLPRVKVMHPMSWNNYLAYTMTHEVDIGLAPLLPSEFNAARGAIKFFDFARMGAFGIYTNVAPYSDVIAQNVDGLLLENNIDIWISSLLLLVDNPEKRASLVSQAILKAQRLSSSLNVKLLCEDVS